jgi:hypothetical protein
MEPVTVYLDDIFKGDDANSATSYAWCFRYQKKMCSTCLAETQIEKWGSILLGFGTHK